MEKEFILTQKAKIKAKHIRRKYEKNFRIYNNFSRILLFVSIISFVLGMLLLYFKFDENLVVNSMWFFTITLTISMAIRALLGWLTSFWIYDRMNERIWIKDKTLYHFYMTPCKLESVVGPKYSTKGEGVLFSMNIDTIKKAKYDKKSKRIEFNVNGTGKYYEDCSKSTATREWNLNNFFALFYDYADPSLYETLVNMGVQFDIEKINYKIKGEHHEGIPIGKHQQERS